MEVSAKTDKGNVRDSNQDAYFISSGTRHPLFIIADGMGGHKAGEVAANMGIQLISTRLVEISKNPIKKEEITDAIKNSINVANEKIYKKSLTNEKYEGMGTTVTVAYKDNWDMYIGHVGDSRAYLLRQDSFQQLTRDHSLVEELMRNGSITKEEAENHPQRNIITRAVGTSEDVEIDLLIKELRKDDILLLCSDGLSNMLSDEEIKDILLNSLTMNKACDDLVKLSKARGGFDNITVIAIKF